MTNWTGFGVGALIFVAAMAVVKLLGIALGGLVSPWVLQYLHLILMAMLAFLAAGYFAEKSALEVIGITRPNRRAIWRWVLPGMAIGFVGAIIMKLSPAEGMGGLIEGGNIVAVLLMIWMLGPIAEEVLCRGFVLGLGQTQLALTFLGFGITKRNLMAALLFGLQHLAILMKGADGWTTGLAVFFTFILGLACGQARERYHSLLPAIVCHVGYNFGGALGGIGWMAAAKLIQ